MNSLATLSLPAAHRALEEFVRVRLSAVIVCVATLTVASLFGTSGAHADPVPPQLVGLTFSGATVDVTNGDATLTGSVTASGDPDGVRSVEISLWSPDGTQRVYADVPTIANPVIGSTTLDFALLVDRYVTPGEWSVHVLVWDSQSHLGQYPTADPLSPYPAGVTTSMSVVNNAPPATPPPHEPRLPGFHNPTAACVGAAGTWPVLSGFGSAGLHLLASDPVANTKLTTRVYIVDAHDLTQSRLPGGSPFVDVTPSQDWDGHGRASVALEGSSPALNLPQGQYAWRAATTDGNSWSPVSSWCYFVVDSAPPGQPSVLDEAGQPVASLTAVWRRPLVFRFVPASAGEGVTAYTYSVSTGYHYTDATAPAGADGTATVSIEPEYGTTQVSVQAHDAAGNVSPTRAWTLTMSTGEPKNPTVPQAIGVRSGDRKVTVSWQPPATTSAPIVGYELTPVHWVSGTDTVTLDVVRVANVRSATITGLSNNERYEFKVRALTSYAWGLTATSPQAVPRIPTALTWTKVPSIAPYGVAITVSGHLERADNHAPAAGAPVRLLVRNVISGYPWGVIATRNADAHGNVTFTSYVPKYPVYVRIEHVGVGMYGSSAPNTRELAVTLRTSLAATATAVRIGTAVTLYGVVAPNESGHVVYLQNWNGTHWANLASQTLNTRSGFAFRWVPTRGGTTKFRVVASAVGSLRTGVSATRSISAS